MVLGHQGNRLFPAYTGTGVRHESFERAGIDVDFVNRRNENALVSFLKMPNGFVARTRKLTDHEVFFRSNFYRKLVAPMGQGHFMTLKLDSHVIAGRSSYSRSRPIQSWRRPRMIRSSRR